MKYVVHIANGSGSVANVIDRNSDKAIGTQLFFKIPSPTLFGSMIGGSFYTDENFETKKRLILVGGSLLLNIFNIIPEKITLIGEVAYKKENATKWLSWYGFLQYSFKISEWIIGPYFIYDFADYDLDKDTGKIQHIGGGLNILPIPQLILKIEILSEGGQGIENNLIIGGGLSYAF